MICVNTNFYLKYDFFLLSCQVDQVIRQRSLSSLELFLSCAQKQLNTLLQEDPPATAAEQTSLPP